MKKKRSTRKKLKDKAWELTSLYIRLSHSDENGYCSCVTCGMTKHYKDMQAGHFIPQAQGDAIRFDLRNIAPQCYRCNINLGGNGAEFFPYMERAHGREVIDELREKSRTTVKFTAQDFRDMIDLLNERLEQLGVYA